MKAKRENATKIHFSMITKKIRYSGIQTIKEFEYFVSPASVLSRYKCVLKREKEEKKKNLEQNHR